MTAATESNPHAFVPPSAEAGPMKVGVTFLYAIFKHGYPPKVEEEMSVVPEIAKRGFHYLELEGLGKEHQDEVNRRRADYKRLLGDHGMHVHNFCTVNRDLVSLDDARRAAAYDEFRVGAELAAYFDAETLHLASYAPAVRYVTGVPYGSTTYEFQKQIRAEIPDGFDWQRQWDVLIESVTVCTKIAAEFGRCIIMEPRVGEIICSSDSMLRMLEQANRPNLYANFDTGHFHAQRETLAITLEKLKGKYANVHIADNDQLSPDHLPLGDGTIDWENFFRGLKRHGYGGYIGLDLGGKETILDDLTRSWEFIQEMAGAIGFEVER